MIVLLPTASLSGRLPAALRPYSEVTLPASLEASERSTLLEHRNFVATAGRDKSIRALSVNDHLCRYIYRTAVGRGWIFKSFHFIWQVARPGCVADTLYLSQTGRSSTGRFHLWGSLSLCGI